MCIPRMYVNKEFILVRIIDRRAILSRTTFSFFLILLQPRRKLLLPRRHVTVRYSNADGCSSNADGCNSTGKRRSMRKTCLLF